MIYSYFTKHLKDAKENYFQHLYNALKIALPILLAGIIMIIHAILPFLFPKYAGNIILKVSRFIAARRELEQ